MKVSEQWLRSWCNPAVSREALASQLTQLGLEVAAVTPVAGLFSGVVVGRIDAVAPHPNADRLRVCTVDVGQPDTLNIVCGANNVASGMCVAVACVGAQLPGDIRIKRSKLRGVESQGMICSSGELGMEEGPAGEIMVLPEESTLGDDLRTVLSLDDAVIDIELTANRGDCASVLGIARELAAVYALPLQKQAAEPVAIESDQALGVTVTEPSACPRYLGRVITGIRSDAVTPLWMQQRLVRSGQQTIHPVVDVLNTVMLEIGLPMHAFDCDNLSGDVVLRYAKSGEALTLLDGKTVSLSERALVIADQQGPQALAGVMGGQSSAVSSETTSIFIEAAYFDPVVIRRSAKAHQQQTDASFRFERGVDRSIQGEAMARATQLLLDIVGGQAGPITEYQGDGVLTTPNIVLKRSEIVRLLGIEIPDDWVAATLARLGIDVVPEGDGWQCLVPSHRHDLTCSADLIEELIRLYGYDQIPTALPRIQMDMPSDSAQHRPLNILRECMSTLGYHEAITYSFISPKDYAHFHPDLSPVSVTNPMSVDMSVMRTSLWPGLLRAVQHNQSRQMSRVRLFELGMSFRKEGDVQQVQHLAMVAAGSAWRKQWQQPHRPVDFYDVKGEVMSMLQHVAADIQWEACQHPGLHPGRTAALTADGVTVGYLGMLHPNLVRAYELQGDVCCFEMKLSALQTLQQPIFQTISKYPSASRDLAMVVDEQVTFAAMKAAIYAADIRCLSDVNIFDVYRSEQIGAGRKSIALSLTFQDRSCTLTEDDVSSMTGEVIDHLKNTFHCELRSM